MAPASIRKLGKELGGQRSAASPRTPPARLRSTWRHVCSVHCLSPPETRFQILAHVSALRGGLMWPANGQLQASPGKQLLGPSASAAQEASYVQAVPARHEPQTA